MKYIFLSLSLLLSNLLISQDYCDTEITSPLINTPGELFIDCDTPLTQGCFTLSVEYEPIPSTTSYEVVSIPYNPIGNFNQGTEIPITSEDVWSSIINMPFEYCLYNNLFDQYIISDNGMISFNTSYQGGNAPFFIAGTNPNPNLLRNTIFGLFHDLSLDPNSLNCSDDPNTPINECGQITYEIIGEAPCRQLVFNFYNVKHFSCLTETSTFQVVLHESSFIIDIHIQDKPLSCITAKEDKSMIGIINSNGTQGISPPNRNTGVWSTSDESWSIRPNGASNEIIRWYADGNLVGQGESIQVCPSNDTEYTVAISYPCGNDEVLVQTDTLLVTFDAEFPVSNDVAVHLCDEEFDGTLQVDLDDYQSSIFDTSTGYTITYYTSETDAINGINPISTIQEIDESNGDTVFYTRVENTASCYTISSLLFRMSKFPYETIEIEFCDEGNDGEQIINNLISAMGEDVTQWQSNYTFSVHETENDALLSQNPITDPYTITSGTNTLYVRLQNTNFFNNLSPYDVFLGEDCFLIVPYLLTLNPGLDLVTEIEEVLCQITPTEYDLTLWEDTIANGNTGLMFSYFLSEDDALNNLTTEIIPNPTVYISQTGAIEIYVRVVDPEAGVPEENWCSYIAHISITIATQPNEYSVLGCDENGDGFVTYNIEQLFQNYVDQYYPDTTFSEYYFFPNAFEYIDWQLTGDLDGQITDPSNFVVSVFESPYEVFIGVNPETECIPTLKLILNTLPIFTDTEMSFCDIGNDQTEFIVFNGSLEYPVINYQSLEFYLTELDAINGVNPITTFQASNTNTSFFIKALQGECETIQEIDVILNAPENVEEVTLEICDINADGEQTINLNQINSEFTGTYVYTSIEFYNTFQDALNKQNKITNASNYTITSDGQTLYYLLSGVDACYNPGTLIVNFLDESLVVENDQQAVCNEGFVYHEFDLTESIPNMISEDPANYTISYHYTLNDLENDIPISESITQYPSYETQQDIFVKFIISEDCYSYGTIQLIIDSPPKLISTVTTSCDSNFDGNQDIDLTTLNSLIVGNPSGLTFSYYETFSDAQNQTNPIIDETNYSYVGASETIFIGANNQNNCYAISQVIITPNNVVDITINPEIPTIALCDDDISDGITVFDLTTILPNELTNSPNPTLSYYTSQDDANNEVNPITNPSSFTNTQAYEQIIFVRFSSEGLCDNWTTIQLVVYPIPEVTLEDVYTCPDVEATLIPVTDDNGTYTYEWRNAFGDIIATTPTYTTSEPGTYTVTATNTYGCSFSTQGDLILYEVPVIVDLQETENTITVIAEGNPVLEYSIDGIQWQVLDSFTDLIPGRYTVYIRSTTTGCYGDPKETIIVRFSNIITPNGDGINDAWIVTDLDVFDEAITSFYIYDRYGKLIYKEESTSRIEWSGKYLGRSLPTDTYYYTIQLGDGRQYFGYIVIKNFAN